MAEYTGLSYKTRGQANPQGRPRIFFCCHEADHASLFEPITEEIMEMFPNAAFWYHDPKDGAPDDPQFFDDLSQMQLFVIAVTARFLYEESRARTVEFPYALDHNIPVLPLMQEPGLARDFNRICGNLQFLDKVSAQSDLTAIPYGEKLYKFLHSVLVSDTLAKRIRDAFDTCIFLSYRKKDRAHAQKIMRLIHENAFCRDIAIWYDEFLNLGEDFNDAILASINKSALFALVVTPGLLDDPNYVLTDEYPAAQKAGKPILPIEAQSTDMAELYGLYGEGMPPVVPQEQIAERLRNILKGIALRKNDHDPMHNFLIGLAYLSGIDVEVDHEKAVALITSAAEADLPEACEKLSSMYKNGEGVGRDKEKAIFWQEKLVGLLKKRNDEAPGEANAVALVDAELALFRLYKELSDYSFYSHNRAYLDAIIACEGLCSEYNNYRLYLAIAEMWLLLVPMGQFVGHYETALTWCKKARTATIAALFNCTLNALQTAPVHENGRLDQDVLARMIEETRLACERCDLAIDMGEAGLYRAQGTFEKALAPGASAIEKGQKLAAQTGSPSDMSLLALCYIRHHYTLSEMEDYDRAEVMLRKALDIHRQLEERTHRKQYTKEIVHDMRDLAVLAERRGDDRAALEHYLQAYRLYTETKVEPSNFKGLKRGAQICIALGRLYFDKRAYQESERYYEEARDILPMISGQVIVRTEQTLEILLRLGDIALNRGDYQKFESDYFHACNFLSEFIEQEEDPEIIRAARENLAECFLQLGLYLKDVDALFAARARSYLVEANAVSSCLNSDAESPRMLFVMYKSSLGLAWGYDREKDYRMAEYFYESAIESQARRVEMDPRPVFLTDLAKAHYALAMMYRKEGKSVLYIRSLEKARDMYRRSVEKEKDEQTLLLYALCLSTLGSLYAKNAEQEKAVDHLEKAASVLETLRKDRENEIVEHSLAVAYLQLADLTKDRVYLEKAKHLASRLTERHPDAVQYQKTREIIAEKEAALFGPPPAPPQPAEPSGSPLQFRKIFFSDDSWKKKKE